MASLKSIIGGVDPNSARIYGIVARETRQVVLFRRGPTRQVRLIKWNLQDDTLELGQWFRGRIYERRCDLSPSGDKLLYFAAKYREPLYSWTAISNPPFLTALALWPNGTCWGGGGLFDNEHALRLNHYPGEFKLADGFATPRNLKVAPLGEHSGKGEDDPIMSIRLARDGWAYLDTGSKEERGGRASGYSRRFDPPLAMEKSVGRSRDGGRVLRVSLHAIRERQGRWYAQTADLLDRSGKIVLQLGRIDWADVDHNGDVLYAKDGCIFRLKEEQKAAAAKQHLVADLNEMSFEAIEAPSWAKRWQT